METETSQTKPATIKVVATTGGFKTFVAFLAAMFIFLIVFLVGIIAGISGFAAATEDSGSVRTHISHEGDSNKIAVLNISGVIDASNASYAEQAINEILEDKHIRAVVLRVDSPGGGVTASDEIWHNIQRLKDAKLPLIASYGGIAASGGYYISCNSDHIIAQETTITGSIGVIANIMTFQDLLEMIGVKPVTLIAKDSPQKSVANDVFRNWTVKDKQKVTGILDAMYSVFYSRVEEGRGDVITDSKKLEEVANGSAYTAQQALTNGLIDGIGYLDDAISIAEQRASLTKSDSTIVSYNRSRPSFGGLFGAKENNFSAEELRTMIQELSMPKLMYLFNN
ncbi:MAG: signal peptide peptidase SppA [Phycisphaerales bacterium]|jgi:protease-4|nr:signal peptide peptidase SppA [Phycisphaerales bacterium]